jgi:hypothetical protein
VIPAATHIAVAPLLPLWAVIALAALALPILAVGWWSGARGMTWRFLAALALWLALLNPSLVSERREPRPDVAVVVIDETPSQRIGNRLEDARQALDTLTQRLAQLPGLETRVLSVTGSLLTPSGDREDGTRLFDQLGKALGEIPRQRLAGIVALTDGQVHDAPNREARDSWHAPFHVLLTGQPGEADRRIVLQKAPTYGLVGKPVAVTVRIEDPATPTGQLAVVSVRRDGGAQQRLQVPVGRDTEIPVGIEHSGQSVFEIAAEAGPRELTLENNRAVLAINGVRDRLRVLLVSGEPHAGERTWRSLLKADPSVDLVHFTILRPPEKQDGTPIRELSLIAFPIRELFELKLDEFDLIIFDRYKRQGVLPRAYISNIAEYVQKGGALLDAAGTPFASAASLYRSPLGAVMPVEPTGEVYEGGFKPMLTDVGRRHPVTADLPGGGESPTWGRWFRLIDGEARKGEVVMRGVYDRPLLVLDRVGKGRVAQLLSDHIWLWTRGYEGGGPQAELLRRLAHWLMKEPELEENDLRAQYQGGRLEVVRRSLKPDERPVEVTLPGGEKTTVTMADDAAGRAIGSLSVDRPGLYRVSDGQRTAVAAVGALNPLEYADVRATDRILSPITEATGGSLHWLKDGLPEVRRVRPGRPAEGRGWIGFRTNNDYAVTGVDELPLLPAFLVLALAIGALMIAWRREGQ